MFKYYNYLFTNYSKEYIEKSNDYVSKIKVYLDIFNNVQPFYIKSLVLIFEKDNYEKRVTKIIWHSIRLIKKYIHEIKKRDLLHIIMMIS